MKRPTPRAEGLNREFYDRMAEGSLHFQRCAECGRWRHPPRYLCPHCNSERYRWEPSRGRGEVYSWTVTHRTLHPAFEGTTPYAAVVVELEEGVRLVSAIRDLDPSELRLGLPVEVEFEAPAEGFTLHHFRPRA